MPRASRAFKPRRLFFFSRLRGFSRLLDPSIYTSPEFQMANTQLWQLVARKLSGEASLDELRELEQLLQEDPEMAYKVDVYTSYFEHPSGHLRRAEADKQQSWENCLSKLKEEFPGDFTAPQDPLPDDSRRRTRKWMVAGSICVVLALAAFFFQTNNRGEYRDKTLADQAPLLREMNTLPGTRSRTVLPDGTIVWLNSESRLTYNADFGKHKREVTLVGEAFFDVTHNADVPMVVHAKNINIWVKGTAFNVRSYPESRSVETSLIRGAVELTTDADPERRILLKPNEKITIEAKPERNAAIEDALNKTDTAQQGTYRIQKLKETSLSNIIPEISWVQDKLVFDNEKFTDIIRKMEKWYNVEIVLENKELGAKSFSGIFGKENISQALEALQIINHFEFEINDGKVFIK